MTMLVRQMRRSRTLFGRGGSGQLWCGGVLLRRSFLHNRLVESVVAWCNFQLFFL